MNNKFDSILIVEDEVSLHETLAQLLKYYSDNLLFASNGEDALELYKNSKQQLIVSDIEMPKMNGIEFCKKVKEINPNQYFIFLTAFNDNELLHKAIQLHVNGFLIKPLLFKDLKQEFDHIFKEIELKTQVQKKEEVEDKYFYLKSIINGMNDSIKVIDKDYNVLLMNDTAENSINSKYIKNMHTPKCYEISHHTSQPCSGNNHICPLEKVLLTNRSHSTLHHHFDKENNELLEQVTITPLVDKHGNITEFIEHCTDVTELVKVQESLFYERNYDLLTELPNKERFIKHLEESINISSHHKLMSCLILIDIDDLKTINDSFGHKTGDEIIIQFAKWIKEIIRQEDTVSRLSGDNFAIILNQVEDKLAPVRLIRELQEKANSSSIEVMYNDIQITFCSGISVYPQDGTTTDTLFKNADSALHEAKKSGKNIYKFYEEELTQKALEKIVFESNIKSAIHNNDFSLFFQPQYTSKDDSLIGMEVLIRLENSPIGIVSPNKFIPYLEDSGLIEHVGNWILESIFNTVASWKTKKYTIGRVSVNVSLNQLKNGDIFIENIKTLLEKTKCNPKDIGLEITESAFMENYEDTIQTLRKLQKLGFYLLLDDFGTGYSSLSHLSKMPIDKLKIDKSFIDGVLENKDDKVIAKTIIDLAKSLDLDIIAEGVEKKEQVEFLQQYGCFDIQGYFYSKPLSMNDIEYLLKQKNLC